MLVTLTASDTFADGSLTGRASWYCNRDASRGPLSPCHYLYPDTSGYDAYAAAGPRLRAMLGRWRNRVVLVDGLRVRLVDWCQCYKGTRHEKLIDLYRDVFGRTGSRVRITLPGRVPAPTPVLLPPETDTAISSRSRLFAVPY